MGPLTGIKVVDFTLAHAGTMTSMLLADYGAEVIKIEKLKTGELARGWAPFDADGNSGYFAYLNRGKKDVCIDGRSPEGKEAILKLIAEADVVTENFKYGSMERMGLGYDELKKVNPKLIYASLNGFGQTGPRKNVIGLDLHLQSMAGVIDSTGYPDKAPTRVGAALSDQIVGVYMAIAILIATIHAEKTGEGQKIDIGILDAVFSMIEGSVATYSLTGTAPSRNGNSYPAISPYDTFAAKDGRISIGVCTDRQWTAFCDCLGISEYATDERYKTNELRGANYELGLRDFLESKTKEFGRYELEAKLMEAKIPCSVVCTVPEAMANPQTAARDMLIKVMDPAMGEIIMPGIPIKMTNAPGGVAQGAPTLGQDTEHYLKAVGYSDADIADMLAKNIIQLG
ncbi:CaiB/BaiF CoA-transferase family protein [Chakrabartyella piscis]|uniref:CaiB/BaiF CoA transferase family protein n=1 Tax=Chakrabartyella piscis TaxID=2918914 RepID=UPI0029586340|nr:CaiB/BaiF CoA-transferase family protein [Chakrabartyella piscis]